MLVIDEISMMGCAHFLQVDERLRSLRRNVVGCENKPFGGLPVVLFAGDFMQFPPVDAVTLGTSPSATNAQAAASTLRGRLLFAEFSKVVMLDVQVRAQNDVPFREFLTRLRSGKQSRDDAERLNKLCVEPAALSIADDLRIVTPLKRHRWELTLAKVAEWASNKGSLLTICISTHTWKDHTPTPVDLLSAMLVGDETNWPVPAVFPYTPGMPICVLKNQYVGLKAANGSMFEAVDILLDPMAKVHYYSCSLRIHVGSPLGIILRSNNTRHLNFPNLPPGTILIPSITTRVPYTVMNTRRKETCSRKGLPCTPGFVITDYKSQGKTLTNAVVGLYGRHETGGAPAKCDFVSLYVQLSRPTSFANLRLLRPLNVEEFIEASPQPEMTATIARLTALSVSTIASWESRHQEDTRTHTF
ncbi:hypothetical protein DFS34DRAFT_642025 [Phlyctochytrium arcticum]|nr:hypothetical protein DFS34DRAFT_642025 [Phlyctochytrium arcticum]